jgi:peptidoglycan hydrolase-like protein with peptidoglycan-binding domain
MKSIKLLVILSCFIPIYAFAMPSYPMAFWGSLTIDGVVAPVGTVVTVYDASSTLLGEVTVSESGVYGYDSPVKQKLLVAESVGSITFKTKVNGGTETSGCSAITYSGFVSGLTEEKNLAFKTFGCTTVPNNTGIATLSTTTTQVVITSGATTTSLTVGTGTLNPTIDVSSFISNGTGTLPAINIVSTNANNVTVAISASTTVISASTTWNGIISAPTVTTVTLPAESGQTKTLSTAIEVGLTDSKLTFSKSVKLLLPNQAGKRVGYTRTGSAFTEITNVCVSLNDQVAIDSDLIGLKEECKIDSGSDMIIWTKHFTTFASYTQTPVAVVVSSGGGGGGGGGSVNSYIPPVVIATTSVIMASTTNNNTQKQVVTISENIKGQVLGSTTYNFTKDLNVGVQNNDVKELQKILIADGFLKSEATGYFGPITKQALIKWQIKNKTTATGVFDSASRKIILSRVNVLPVVKVLSPVTFSFANDLRVGSRGADVIELQKILISDGFLSSEATGNFGMMTKTALMRWQTKNKIPSTGNFGAMTRAFINKGK